MAAKELELIRNVADKLTEGMMQHFARPDCVTLAMRVNVQAARADFTKDYQPVDRIYTLLRLYA